MASQHRYVARSELPVSRRALFDWFGRDGAFERLAPPFEPIQDIEREGGLQVGARTAMTVKVGPAKTRWVAKHTIYVEGEMFQDEQVEGPFKRFTNLHRMIDAGENRSVMEDVIEYELPAGALGDLAGSGIARHRLESVFAYRHAILGADLGRHAQYADRPRQHVAVTGASGLIGSALVPFLTTGGHTVTRVPHRALENPQLPDDVDAVVHLAGAPIAEGRWTAAKKAEIADSRGKATRAFCEALARRKHKPRVLISGSAIGYYGDRGGETLTEASGPGEGFLADVCREWEAATRPAEEAGIRVVHLRTGIVLTPKGGALAAMLPAFKAGAGGRMGSGEQFMSWISIEDELGLIHWALFDESARGALNAAAPTPVAQVAFARTLGEVLHRPTVAPAPAAALKLLLGAEKAKSILLDSQKVHPEVALRGGFRFLHPELLPALRFVLGVDRLPSAASA